jgi:hypothetical protein
MIILTYIVRTALLIGLIPLSMVMYAIVKQLADKEQW